jgi:uncharacterized BrkB/YihY/UPF0761 family membrane protein
VVLRIIATLLTLSPVIGLLVTLCGMMVTFQTLAHPAVLHPTDVAGSLSVAITATSIGLLLFPIGVCLHWFIAQKTGTFPSSARQALFVGSVFACIGFPLGTVMGAATIWLLIRADTFRKHREKPQSQPQ